MRTEVSCANASGLTEPGSFSKMNCRSATARTTPVKRHAIIHSDFFCQTVLVTSASVIQLSKVTELYVIASLAKLSLYTWSGRPLFLKAWIQAAKSKSIKHHVTSRAHVQESGLVNKVPVLMSSCKGDLQTVTCSRKRFV